MLALARTRKHAFDADLQMPMGSGSNALLEADPPSQRQKHGTRLIQRLHRDERGAISVLALLTIWCLVAIVGLLWNTMEESYRRERIQTAADAAAHAAATWMSRTLNAVDAQNMVISQDASTEVIWRAVPAADLVLTAQMKRELNLAQQMKATSTLQALVQRLQFQVAGVASEYQLTTDALNNLKAGTGANYLDANEVATYNNLYRQAESVNNWVYNTYVMGARPPRGAVGAPPRPGPPGPNGEGLAQIVQTWVPARNESEILDYIIDYINTTEIPIIRAFEKRTAPATAQAIDTMMAAHEAEAYQNELAMADTLAATIETQRQEMADFYKTDITLATLQNLAGNPGPATVHAPLMPAEQAPAMTGYTDTIRTAFPHETMLGGLSPVFDIDAINVHVRGAIIWHPDMPVSVPNELRAQYPSLRTAYQIHVNLRDLNNRPIGWGECWAMPLEHYVRQRVNADAATLNGDYMAPLDQARMGPLRQAVRIMLGLPNNGNIHITNLPGRLPDDQAEPNIPPIAPPNPIPPPRFDQINVMPAITAPANATAGFRAQVALYNQHAGAYTGAVRALRGTINSYTAFFDDFTQGFAQNIWRITGNNMCLRVLETLGQNKQFMVLSTYGLRPIPDWAKPGMFDSAQAAIENQIMVASIQPAAQDIVQDLKNADPNRLGAGILDQTFRDSVLYNGYIGLATAIADSIIRPEAHAAALRLAAEWVNRPWPYEITPPAVPVPPFRGIGPDERKSDYSLLAAARQTDASAPRLLLPAIFGADRGKLAAYGQGEAFNWMEFNAAYGGGERFDEVVPIPETAYYIANQVYHPFVGAPRGWRVGSLGGWNWRSRLSLSDTLYDALGRNDELREYLHDAGINNPGSGALDEINLH